ncbi:hypothetical protein AGMMS50212_12410 [Spirochaetia bacterium]|nr:hypothetical protein AGMMS50212_12410 [Spirochaetia bacterium]
MAEDTIAPKLWVNFHHLSEADKDLVLTVAELAAKTPKACVNTDLSNFLQAKPKKTPKTQKILWE